VNQTLLFIVGVGVFAITVCATLYYGYVLFNRTYQADVAGELAARQPGGAPESGLHPVSGVRPVTSALP